MSRGRTTLARLFAAATVLALTAPLVFAAPSGPTYPPPGGVTLTPSGHLGRAGGLTWSYADLDMDRFNGIWWGPASATSFRFALDGAIDAAGETLVFDFGSDTAAGQARWVGTTSVRHFSGGAWVVQSIPLRLTLRAMLPDNAPIPFVDPASVGLDGDLGAVVAVPGDYKVHVLLEGQRNGVWTPAYDLYDSLQTDPACSCVRLSVGAGFYVDLNQPPVASFAWSPQTPVERKEVTFTSSSSDPEGRPLVEEWDLDGDGVYGDATGPTATTTFHDPGTYTVGLRVTDDRGLVASSVRSVTVADCARGPVSDLLRNVAYPLVEPVAANTAWSLACDVAADELGV
ncbi:MAG TPA: PKD domain-containing protein [Candidatus Thermoplasmatota archaeon]|nr:PKD domain-containing protein [Candidatus Thermoplasmatota archaeon]